MTIATHTSRTSLAEAIFRAAAYAVPLLIALQFFLVGVAVFADGGGWDLHRANGGLIGLPVLVATALALARPELKG